MAVHSVWQRLPARLACAPEDRRRRLALGACLVLGIALGAAACDESLSSIAGPTPNLEPTFSSISEEIFQSTDVAGRVACVNCHTTAFGVPAGGLSLLPDVAYENLVGRPSSQKPAAIRVVPGDPDNSYLIHKLEGGPDIEGLRMPLIGPPYLTSGQVLVIRRWIEDGAQNN